MQDILIRMEKEIAYFEYPNEQRYGEGNEVFNGGEEKKNEW